MKQQIDSTMSCPHTNCGSNARSNLDLCMMFFLVGSVLLIVSVFCDVRYNYLIKTMFGSSLPPVVYRREPYLRCFCLFAYSSVFVFSVSPSCPDSFIPNVFSFSRLFFFVLPLWCSLTFIYTIGRTVDYS